MSDDIPVNSAIRIGTDQFGDPILTVDITTPPNYIMTPDTTEALALKLLAAAAAARARASVIRSMVLDGAREEDARRLADEYLKM